jgi:hypothetical protein
MEKPAWDAKSCAACFPIGEKVRPSSIALHFGIHWHYVSKVCLRALKSSEFYQLQSSKLMLIVLPQPWKWADPKGLCLEALLEEQVEAKIYGI